MSKTALSLLAATLIATAAQAGETEPRYGYVSADNKIMTLLDLASIGPAGAGAGIVSADVTTVWSTAQPDGLDGTTLVYHYDCTRERQRAEMGRGVRIDGPEVMPVAASGRWTRVPPRGTIGRHAFEIACGKRPKPSDYGDMTLNALAFNYRLRVATGEIR